MRSSCELRPERGLAGDVSLADRAVVAQGHEHEQLGFKVARDLHAMRHGRRRPRIEHNEIGEGAGRDRADLAGKAERGGITARDQIECDERRQVLALHLHHLVGLGGGAQHGIGRAAADIGRERNANARAGEPRIVEQAAADEEIGGRAEHRDRTAVAQQRQLGIVEMDAMPEKRARAEQAEPGIDRRVARIARKQALDRVDLVAVLGEMRLHQDGGKLRQQRARRRELFVARGDGEARGHGIALPPGAVPAAG